jgi:selenocysteine-specific elongation factor
VTVLDPEPPPLRRRGAAAVRARELAAVDGSLYDEVRRRGLVSRSQLQRIGVDPVDVPEGVQVLGDWLLLDERAKEVREEMRQVVRERSTPLDPGVPTVAVARALGLPDPALVEALVQPPLRLSDGRVLEGERRTLPPSLLAALDALRADLADNPFAAPGADRLRELHLDHRALAALARAQEIVRLDDTVVLMAGSDDRAVDVLRELPQPFTTSEARTALGTSRRVALALLAHLDRRGSTTRLPDDRRAVGSARRSTD